MWRTFLLPLLPGPLLPGVVAPNRILSKGWIEIKSVLMWNWIEIELFLLLNCVLMLKWILWKITALKFKLWTYAKLNCLKVGKIELNCILMLNWTVYMNKNGLCIK